jgi:hypothetical protein
MVRGSGDIHSEYLPRGESPQLAEEETQTSQCVLADDVETSTPCAQTQITIGHSQLIQEDAILNSSNETSDEGTAKDQSPPERIKT